MVSSVTFCFIKIYLKLTTKRLGVLEFVFHLEGSLLQPSGCCFLELFWLLMLFQVVLQLVEVHGLYLVRARATSRFY